MYYELCWNSNNLQFIFLNKHLSLIIPIMCTMHWPTSFLSVIKCNEAGFNHKKAFERNSKPVKIERQNCLISYTKHQYLL